MTTPGATSDHPHRKLGARHHRRVVLLLQISSGLTTALCLAWATYFALSGQWGASLALTATSACGVLSYRLGTLGRVFLAGIVQFVSLYSVICFASLLLDLPSEQVARTTHLFLLPLGAGAHMGLRGAKPWFRYTAVTLFFTTFALFACTSIGWHTGYALSDDVRIIGSKIDTLAATVALFLMMYVMQADVEARNAYEADLRTAVANRQLTLYYQPQVDIHGQLQGAEALVRWIHPRQGMVSPAEFIPLAEKTGLILPIGSWVLETACQHLQALARHPDTADLVIAVNVSAHQIQDPNFVVEVLSIVEQSGIKPDRLKLELTESALVHNMDDIEAKMSALQKHGITFSLDDFGTGYSSLAYLKRLPLNQLKIDQAFVRDLLTHPKDLAIASTVINLGQSLNLTVIAEGVETEQQRDMLTSIGCRHFQGYLYGKPAPFDQLLAFAERTRQLPSTSSMTPDAPEEARTPSIAQPV